MNQEKIGKFIQNVRKDKKITQSELAEKLGVSDLQANPYDNIRVGVDYISDLFEQYDNPYDVLNVYNSGSTDGYAHEYSITVMERFYRIEHELWDSMEGW